MNTNQAQPFMLTCVKDPSKSIQIKNNTQNDDSAIHLWQKGTNKNDNSYMNQAWKFDGQKIVLVNSAASLGMSFKGQSQNGSEIILGDADSVETFKVDELSPGGPAIIRSAKDPRKCLQLDCGRTANGTRIHLSYEVSRMHPDYMNQLWKMEVNV